MNEKGPNSPGVGAFSAVYTHYGSIEWLEPGQRTAAAESFRTLCRIAEKLAAFGLPADELQGDTGELILLTRFVLEKSVGGLASLIEDTDCIYESHACTSSISATVHQESESGDGVANQWTKLSQEIGKLPRDIPTVRALMIKGYLLTTCLQRSVILRSYARWARQQADPDWINGMK